MKLITMQSLIMVFIIKTVKRRKKRKKRRITIRRTSMGRLRPVLIMTTLTMMKAKRLKSKANGKSLSKW